MDIGDWVQAAEDVTEPGFEGDPDFAHARRGGIGHVISLTDDPEVVDVYWERTGSKSTCHVSELIRLGGADVGRVPIEPVPVHSEQPVEGADTGTEPTEEATPGGWVSELGHA
jgi:hypothetical protein